MILDIHLLVSFAVLAVFFGQSLKHGAWHWFWASIVIWLASAWFSAQWLPRLLGVTHHANAYLLHGYMLLASVFFWANHVQKQPAHGYQSRAGCLLTLLAQSLLAMHAAFALLALATWYEFPHGLSIYIAGALGSLYMQPAIWWAITIWLMLLSALTAWAWQNPIAQIRGKHIIALSVAAFFVQAAFVVGDLYSRFSLWIR